MPIKKTILAVLLAALTPVSPVQAGSRGNHPTVKERPSYQPGQVTQGRQAMQDMKRMGVFDSMAARYGKTPADFEAMLNLDQTISFDSKGYMFYTEPTVAADPIEIPLDPSPLDESIPTTQAFLLHSKPGSPRTIYLDFDGLRLTGTGWNTMAGQDPIDLPAYNTQGDSSFTSTELANIIKIWRQVSEDFAPFDVDVTTEAPSQDRISRSHPFDEEFGTVLVFTEDFFPGGCNCGGISYVGVYSETNDTYKPSFVFRGGIAGVPKYAAEAGAHEIFHSLGLSHDGRNAAAYYPGHGDWGPIMGNPYQKGITQLSKGEYSGATNTEDDHAVVQQNGISFESDPVGDTIGTAMRLTSPDYQNYAVSSILGTPSDVDVFRIIAGQGNMSVTVSPVNFYPNLNIKATLTDVSGNVLASSDSTSSYGATLNYNNPMAAGLFVHIEGVGQGTVDTGFSDYGSQGLYSMTANVQNASLAGIPKAEITASSKKSWPGGTIKYSGESSSDVDGQIVSYEWNFGDGEKASGMKVNKLYVAPGVYTTTLTVTDNQGLSGEDTFEVTVGF